MDNDGKCPSCGGELQFKDWVITLCICLRPDGRECDIDLYSYECEKCHKIYEEDIDENNDKYLKLVKTPEEIEEESNKFFSEIPDSSNFNIPEDFGHDFGASSSTYTSQFEKNLQIEELKPFDNYSPFKSDSNPFVGKKLKKLIKHRRNNK